MEIEDNIIAIRKCNIEKAYTIFSDYMSKVEKYLNAEAYEMPSYYQKLSPSELEEESLEVMRRASDNTPFRSEEIKLVSGSSFPDIVAEQYYGVEVKSTKSNHWTTVGGSISENTRINRVEDVYLLFGNLGGMPPRFKLRPYKDCLYDITVTHSPRYLINMNLNQKETIFNKMNTTYDDFRMSSNPISTVRHYYRQKAINEQKGELPWWLSDQGEQSSMMIKSFKSLDSSEKDRLMAIMFLLFNVSIIRGQYDEVAVWLLSSQNVINSSLRDLFSAGGRLQFVKIGSQVYKLKHSLPAMVGRLVKAGVYIRDNHTFFHEMVELYNPQLLINGYDCVYNNWIESSIEEIVRIENKRKSCCDKNDIPLRKWIEANATLIVKPT